MFCDPNKSFSGHYGFFFHIGVLHFLWRIGGKSYGFSDADHQAATFENIFQKSLYNYVYCKEILKCSEVNKFDYVQKLIWVENRV